MSPSGLNTQTRSSSGTRRCGGNHRQETDRPVKPAQRRPSARGEGRASPSPSASRHRRSPGRQHGRYGGGQFFSATRSYRRGAEKISPPNSRRTGEQNAELPAPFKLLFRLLLLKKKKK